MIKYNSHETMHGLFLVLEQESLAVTSDTIQLAAETLLSFLKASKESSCLRIRLGNNQLYVQEGTASFPLCLKTFFSVVYHSGPWGPTGFNSFKMGQ